MLTQERLKKLLSYDPETGIFRWNSRAGRYGRIPAGSIAGGVNCVHGYHQISIDGRQMKSHRLAWFYMTGAWPSAEIDHINRLRSDNRFANLRKATLQQNLKNKEIYRSNTSGYPGVTWHKRVGMWQARISNDTKRHHLGYWDAPETAFAAYSKAKAQMHAVAA